MSKTLINSKITITKPCKNKQMGYYAIVEKQNPEVLKIKAVSANGRGRGYVGTILKDGEIQTSREVGQFLTPAIRAKINLTLDLIFGRTRTKDCSIARKGLVNFHKTTYDGSSISVRTLSVL